jgi:hypothetical protein
VDDMATIAYGTFRAGAGRHAPRPNGTGRLFASLFHRGTNTLVQSVGHDGTVAPHAEFVIFGSVPHEIRPKGPPTGAKVLSWMMGNRRVFARRVWHPGYAGDNYRDTALADALAILPAAVSDSLKGL